MGRFLPSEIEVKWESPTAVYRYFGAFGQLLYIGITNSPLNRNTQHATADWFRYSHYWHVEWFPSRGMALWAENRAILREKPEANAMSRPDYEYYGVRDLWFLEERQGNYRGDFARWHKWNPDRPTCNGNSFDECEAPEWATQEARPMVDPA